MQRFWNKVEKTDACWLWTGNLNHGGYGRFFLGGKLVRAHRLSLEWHLGRTLTGQALHTCDVRNCVNPAHLYEGTPADNMRDRDARGRGQLPTPKLTPEDIPFIRYWLDLGHTHHSIATAFGVGCSTITGVSTGTTWSST